MEGSNCVIIFSTILLGVVLAFPRQSMMKENDDGSWTDGFPITNEGQRHALKSNEDVSIDGGI